MVNFFLRIYHWFDSHVAWFYTILALMVGVLVAMAMQITFQEDITNFFGTLSEEKMDVFRNVRAKDKIVVTIEGQDPDEIAACADAFEEAIAPLENEGYISSITAHVDGSVVDQCAAFVYDYLPIFLKDSDYRRLESRLTEDSVAKAVERVYRYLTSPSGMFVGDIMLRDPFGIGTPIIGNFEKFKPNFNYEIYGGRFFDSTLTTTFLFIAPTYGMGATGKNDYLVRKLEHAKQEVEAQGVQVNFIGGPVVAVYNARQIKKDTATTLSVAVLIIFLLIFFSFGNRLSIPFILIPPAFGSLFAVAMVWLIQGEMSVIAIGAGTVVLGISLSYSIHFVSHLNYSASPEDIIRELAVPLTLGCFTTVGAFAALIFTSSSLLRDLGLFSSLALVGTTLFCLTILPQFLKGFVVSEKPRLLCRIERVVGVQYDTKKWIVIPVILLTVAALFFYSDVKFDSNMANINYMPKQVVDAEARVDAVFGSENADVFVVTGGNQFNVVAHEYLTLDSLLQRCADAGEVAGFVTVSDFIVPVEEQRLRIDRWNQFWREHGLRTQDLIRKCARHYGFTESAFAPFSTLVSREYRECAYSDSVMAEVPIISELIDASAGAVALLCRMSIKEEAKPEVYEKINALGHTMVADRGYFSSLMVEATSQDFNYILWVSSLLVFFTLLLSYGRIELTLMTFLPMAVSWVIILAVMALCDIKFNIVNIILATFIFGIGDDFSIFIMDGLLQEYKNGKQLLMHHKIAIFFSAFTALAGVGVLIFAKHPALRSIAFISVLGLSVVVLISYTVQPMLFKLLVSSQIKKGGFPHTLASLLNTAFCFLYFFLGCVIVQLLMIVLMLLPMKRKRKKFIFHYSVYGFTELFMNTMITVKTIRRNHSGETFQKPAVIIANHQSFIDILLLLSTTPKIVILTNSWVWNSPFFGFIVRYADFVNTSQGYETLQEELRQRVDDGYSIAVFPEGTRSPNCEVLRFHKGAFYLAHALELDIVPIVLYGTGLMSSKKQPFYIKTGVVVSQIMPRIYRQDPAWGASYQEATKLCQQRVRQQFAALRDEFSCASSPYFRDALIKNYIYKGPVLEWYLRVKCRIDNYYDLWNRLLPRQATITDIGCGYGQMAFMLSILSPARRVVAIDYDSNKIDLAQHAFLSNRANIEFQCADMRECEYPLSDAILFNDSLHYVSAEAQHAVLSKAVAHLRPKGIIVVRDGDSSNVRKQKRIDRTELWSTKICKFNKVSQPLSFVSHRWMEDFALQNGLNIRSIPCSARLSATLYILSQK